MACFGAFWAVLFSVSSPKYAEFSAWSGDLVDIEDDSPLYMYTIDSCYKKYKFAIIYFKMFAILPNITIRLILTKRRLNYLRFVENDGFQFIISRKNVILTITTTDYAFTAISIPLSGRQEVGGTVFTLSKK